MRFWKPTESESETTKSGRRIHRTKAVVRKKRLKRTLKYANRVMNAIRLATAGMALYGLGKIRGQRDVLNGRTNTHYFVKKEQLRNHVLNGEIPQRQDTHYAHLDKDTDTITYLPYTSWHKTANENPLWHEIAKQKDGDI